MGSFWIVPLLNSVSDVLSGKQTRIWCSAYGNTGQILTTNRDHEPSRASIRMTMCEVHPVTGNEDPESEQRCSSTLSLTSALDGG